MKNQKKVNGMMVAVKVTVILVMEGEVEEIKVVEKQLVDQQELKEIGMMTILFVMIQTVMIMEVNLRKDLDGVNQNLQTVILTTAEKRRKKERLKGEVLIQRKQHLVQQLVKENLKGKTVMNQTMTIDLKRKRVSPQLKLIE